MLLYFLRHESAGVAHLAEQLICNQQVAGSSPITSSILFGGVPEWPKGADCKSVVSDFGGSNPPPSTRKNDLFRQVVFLVIFAYGKLYCYAVLFGLCQVILCLAQLLGKYNITKTEGFNNTFTK